ncbi:MAG: SIS domain-containing protein [Acidimicrobiia bacterium]
MRDEIGSLPEQLAWQGEVPSVTPTGRVVAAAMGGSAMAAAAAAVAVPGCDVAVHRGYDLPQWVPPQALILAVSYSGDTEETLSVVDQAAARHLDVVAVTAGGMLAAEAARHGFPVAIVPAGHQPRAALGLLVAATSQVLASAAATDVTHVLAEARQVTSRLLEDGAADAAATDLADRLRDSTPVVFGVHGPAALAARRWKTQFNENAKMASWWAELPELNHNELEAWAGVDSDGASRGMGIFLLRDDRDSRLARRADLTKDVLGGACLAEVHSRGDGPLARLFSLTVVGDLLSVEMAERRGADAGAVEHLEEFKRRMRD